MVSDGQPPPSDSDNESPEARPAATPPDAAHEEPAAGDTRQTPAAEETPAATAAPSGELGQTVERPPADPWAGETEIRPLSDVPPTKVGPSGTGVLPPVPPSPEPDPRWSARAQVRPREVEEHVDEGWAEPGRSPVTPILIAVGVIIVIGLIVLAALLLLNNKDSPAPAPTPSASGQATATTAATTAAPTSAAPTSVAPTEVAIPDVRGLSYEDAVAKLASVGLQAKRRDEVSGEQPAGKVVGTDPTAGNTVKTGITITVIVSKGLQTATPTVTASPTPKPTTST
jgi:PASTA domain-containing protein